MSSVMHVEKMRLFVDQLGDGVDSFAEMRARHRSLIDELRAHSTANVDILS